MNKHRTLIGLLLSIVCVFTAANVHGASFEIIQLTDDFISDYQHAIDGGTLAWKRGGDLVYWNGTEIVTLAKGGSYPSLSDGEVVYQKESDIYLWSGGGTTRISNESLRPTNRYASLHKGAVAWEYAQTSQDIRILYWNGQTIQTLSQGLAAHRNNKPSVYDGTVAWSGYDGHDYEIYYWNGSSVEQVTHNDSWDGGPVSLYEGTITWVGYVQDTPQIFYWDGNDSLQITDDPAYKEAAWQYDGRIVWLQHDGNDLEVMYWDGTSIYRITDNEFDEYGPKISENTVAWFAYGGKSFEIFYADVAAEPNHPPVADAGPGQKLEAGADCRASAVLDASASTDADSTAGTNDDIVSFDWYEDATWLASGETVTVEFAPGDHTVTLVVTDRDGLTGQASATIRVVDATAPALQVISIDKTVLWPPNHKMVDVGFEVVATENCGQASDIRISVTSDEATATAPDSGGPEHCPDAVVDADNRVWIRSERSGQGDGRVYRITIQATDSSGNTGSEAVTVSVGKRRSSEAVDSGQIYDATVAN